MHKVEDLKIGCTAGGTTHQDTNIPDITTKVRMVKEAGVFDFIDRTPPDEEFRDLLLNNIAVIGLWAVMASTVGAAALKRPIPIGALTSPFATNSLNLSPALTRSPYPSQQIRAGKPWKEMRSAAISSH